MFKFSPPDRDELERLLARQAGAPLSYPGVGGTRRREVPPGFRWGEASVELGRGAEVFAAAREALRRFAMVPAWARVARDGALAEGTELVVSIRALGVWWRNAARVVYAEDGPRCAAFAYGTLARHVEAGEERFAVEWGEDDAVRYSLRSFSRPRLLAARLAYPLTRALQRRFVRDSLAAMRAAVEGSQ